MGLMSGKIGSRVATRVRSGAARLVSLKRGKAVKIKQPVEDFCPESLVGLANEMDVLIF